MHASWPIRPVKLLLLLLFSLILSSVAFGQDTITYFQRNSPWVSNCIRFCRTSHSSMHGQFIRDMTSDDCQKWCGSAKYKQSKRKLMVDSYLLVRKLGHIQGDSIVWDNFATDSSVVKPVTFKIRKGYLVKRRGLKKATYYDLNH